MGWNAFVLLRASFGRISALLQGSRYQFERLRRPKP